MPILVAIFASLAGCNMGSSSSQVVVYTSLDQPFSEPVLQEFERKTGIKVQPVYDVEAAKTTGLVSRLIAETGQPRADVFWSSEYAQTLLLKDKGVLAPYDSPSAKDIPPAYRDPNNYWTGFAARARVIIVNTNLVPPERRPRSIFDLPGVGKPGEVGIANPLFGTTATHSAALFAALGPDKAKTFFNDLKAKQVRVVDGNSVVRSMVASGEMSMGLTDTDDAFEALDDGKPVAIIYPDQDAMGTLIIPNTVALVKGAPHTAEAQKLIDYLLSQEVEAALAKASSRQMPVRDSVVAPESTPRILNIRAMTVRPEDVAKRMSDSSTWLKDVFLR
jgi:iron(III) transport system substrate-binding protein